MVSDLLYHLVLFLSDTLMEQMEISTPRTLMEPVYRLNWEWGCVMLKAHGSCVINVQSMLTWWSGIVQALVVEYTLTHPSPPPSSLSLSSPPHTSQPLPSSLLSLPLLSSAHISTPRLLPPLFPSPLLHTHLNLSPLHSLSLPTSLPLLQTAEDCREDS